MGYKEEFIDFLWGSGALKVGQRWTLKSGRESPWFVNLRVIADGEGLRRLSKAYASAIKDSGVEFDKVFGPADAGIPYATSVVMSLAEMGINKGALYNRKTPKVYGEALQEMLKEKPRGEVVGYVISLLDVDALPEGITREDFKKMWLFGSNVRDGDRVIMVDDVFTTGQTKYDSINLLNKCADVQYKAVFIAVDRQEVAGGKEPLPYSAIEDFERRTSIPVYSIVNAVDVYTRLKETGRISKEQAKEFKEYLVKYGTDRAKDLLADHD